MGYHVKYHNFSWQSMIHVRFNYDSIKLHTRVIFILSSALLLLFSVLRVVTIAPELPEAGFLR